MIIKVLELHFSMNWLVSRTAHHTNALSGTNKMSLFIKLYRLAGGGKSRYYSKGAGEKIILSLES